SGAGKTTLLNIIGMLDVPDSGSIIIRGQENPKFSSRDSNLLRRYDISYLFQNYGLVDAETVAENIKIVTRFKKLTKQEQKATIAGALEKLGLPGFESKKVYTLSGGEQQRVALAKVLVKSPAIILADEPTGSLDADNRDYIMQMLQDLNEQGKTIVVVSHDPKVAQCAKRHLHI
ncbi:MAG: ATP-binding cassette domain-containing protein, partial [Anaerolineaceae bacterium]|nr:ATP-binding cassette domain-containing protein [Anaerolineaceae bacterium]